MRHPGYVLLLKNAHTKNAVVYMQGYRPYPCLNAQTPISMLCNAKQQTKTRVLVIVIVIIIARETRSWSYFIDACGLPQEDGVSICLDMTCAAHRT
jgi:hypothetical protein